MKLTQRSISALAQVVTGDKGISPYRSGPKLVRLFNEYGADDVYASGFPSRWEYTEMRLRSLLNGKPVLANFIRDVLDPRDFADQKMDPAPAIEFLNRHFRPEGYEVIPDVKHGFRLRRVEGADIEFKYPEGPGKDEADFIDEQLAKCERKLLEGDDDGAITNARSLVEAVLVEIAKGLQGWPIEYDGDLLKLYRHIQRTIKLDPGAPAVPDSLRQMMSGLISVVNGIATARNQMSDSHARALKPARRHARLVVNAAKSIADFLVHEKRQDH